MTKVFQHFYEAELPPQQSYSRGSEAIYVGASGQLMVAAQNVPRFEALGLLIEPEATQYLSDPTDIGQSWTPSDNQGVLTPVAGTTWSLFSAAEVASQGAAWHRVAAPEISVISGRSYAFKVIVKSGSSNSVYVGITDIAGALDSVVTAPINGVFTIAATAAGSMSGLRWTALADDRYVLDGVFTAATTTSQLRFGLGPNSATAGSTIFVEGANLTSLAIPSSFIAGAARARDQLANITLSDGLNLGTVVAGLNYPYGTNLNGNIVKVQDTAQNSVAINIFNDRYFGIVIADSGRQDGLGLNASIGLLGRQAVALSWGVDDKALAVNGAITSIYLDGASPANLDNVQIITRVFPYYLDYLAVHDDILSNADLASESGRTVFQRETFQLPISAETLGINYSFNGLIAGIRQLSIGAAQLVFAGFGFLAKPVTALRRHVPARRKPSFKPKP